jgi:hypothetical protein
MAAVLERFELASLCDRGLVHVASEDELGASAGQGLKDVVTVPERALAPRSPRRSGELVVQSGDAERPGRCRLKMRDRPGEGVGGKGAALLAPGSDRCQADDDDLVRGVHGLGRSEDLVPRRIRARETRRYRVRDVVVPGDGEHRCAERAEDHRSLLELPPSAAVSEIAGRHDELRSQRAGQGAERRDGLGRLSAPDVQVGNVENPSGHGRGRLYTRSVADEAPEIFDDIYLGLRAGGAVRKQRRGEPLSAEEREAIGRWSRLSLWRKAIAVGAFALGTFGLGFTVGGLIFGRWRTARR